MIHIQPSATGISDSAVAYRNVMAEGTLSWSSQTTDGAAANALGPQTFDSWVPAAMPANIATLLPSAVACDTAAIVSHTLGSSGATAYIEASLDNVTWVTFATITPTDDRDIFVLFSDLGGISYPRWRLRVTGATAPAIGIVWIGPRLIIPMGVQASYTPLNLSLTVDLMTNDTRGGQFLGNRIMKKGASTGVNIAPQERWWVQSEAMPFIAHYNAGKPFLWLSCPALHPEDAFYVWRAGDTLSGSYSGGSLWVDMALSVNAYVSQ